MTTSITASKTTVQMGTTVTVDVTVKNKGQAPIYQLRAVTKSDGPYYDEKELVFGKIAPGEQKSATTPPSARNGPSGIADFRAFFP